MLDRQKKVQEELVARDKELNKSRFETKEALRKEMIALFLKSQVLAKWKVVPDKNDLVYEDPNKKGERVTIKIKEDKDGTFTVSFLGRPPSSIGPFANEYHKLSPSMKFEVEANTLGAATRFIQELAKGGFDLNQINHIKLESGEKIQGAKLKEILDNAKKPSSKSKFQPRKGK